LRPDPSTPDASPTQTPPRRTPLDRIETSLDRMVDVVSWIWLVLIGLIALSVILRYVFGAGRVEFEELQWHLYAVGFLAGIVACARRDRHVRVDVFRERMTPRARAWVDFYGVLLLLLPFLALVCWSALPFVVDSFITSERSAAAGGLSHRWIPKAILPISFGLLGLASAARFAETCRVLFGRSDPEESR
jgi:TRAP-type mannitol/chloroaromatic compound transport system permease small subunit